MSRRELCPASRAQAVSQKTEAAADAHSGTLKRSAILKYAPAYQTASLPLHNSVMMVARYATGAASHPKGRKMLDLVLLLFALTAVCLVVVTAPGTSDRAVIWKVIVGAIVAGSVITFAAG